MGVWKRGAADGSSLAVLFSLPPYPSPRRSGPALFVYVAGLASERPGADDFPRGAKELKDRISPSASKAGTPGEMGARVGRMWFERLESSLLPVRGM